MQKSYRFFDITSFNEERCIILKLNQPDTRNVLDSIFWQELPEIINEINSSIKPICVILQAKGDNFTIGLDLKDFIINATELKGESTGEKREQLLNRILLMQRGIKSIYESPSIFIAVINGYCLGAGLDIISACDLRVGLKSAIVSLREAKMGIVADLGSLTYLPNVIGLSKTKLMAYTARDFSANECYQMGLFDFLFESENEAKDFTEKLVRDISNNPSLTLRGVKKNLHYGLEHSSDDSLDFTATWNAAFLDSSEFREAMNAFIEKRKPNFHLFNSIGQALDSQAT